MGMGEFSHVGLMFVVSKDWLPWQGSRFRPASAQHVKAPEMRKSIVKLMLYTFAGSTVDPESVCFCLSPKPRPPSFLTLTSQAHPLMSSVLVHWGKLKKETEFYFSFKKFSWTFFTVFEFAATTHLWRKAFPCVFLFSKTSIDFNIFCACVFCLHECLCSTCVPGEEGRTGLWLPWEWSYRWLQAIKPRSSAKAKIAFNRRGISAALHYFFWNPCVFISVLLSCSGWLQKILERHWEETLLLLVPDLCGKALRFPLPKGS